MSFPGRSESARLCGEVVLSVRDRTTGAAIIDVRAGSRASSTKTQRMEFQRTETQRNTSTSNQISSRACTLRPMRMRRFEFVDGGSSKFWEVGTSAAKLVVRFGRIGTNGQLKEKRLSSAQAAQAQADVLVAEKLKKGYVEARFAGRARKAANSSQAKKQTPSRGAANTLPREIAYLRTCLRKVRHLCTKWDRGLLDSVDLKDATKVNAVMAECHITIGRQAFFIAERAFWSDQPAAADGPDLSCRFNDIDFELVNAAMATPNTTRPRQAARAAKVDYTQAVRHFERAYVLTKDPEANFYLGMIALRNGDLAKARSRFDQVRDARNTGPRRDEHALYISAAVFASIARLLQGRLAEAVVAMKQAKRVDPQDITFMKNHGYLCELQGQDDKAVSWYRETLEWEPQDGYALRRLLPLEGAPVIDLKSPRDFHAKFAQIAVALQKAHGSKRAPKPMPAAMLDKIRLAKRRGDDTSVSLPESVKTILRHDRNFALWDDDKPLLRVLMGPKRVAVSANIDRLVRTDRWSPCAKAFKKLPARVPVWNDDPNLPACIPLHANPRGEQLIFLYIGEPDDSGEYPIARYQEGELWVAEASLIHLIVNEAMYNRIRFKLGCDFDKLLAKAIKRNAKYNEDLSNHPSVQAIAEAT
jgi:predicted DNA-binding WGR domain protein